MLIGSGFGAAALLGAGTGVRWWREREFRLQSAARDAEVKVETDLAPVKRLMPQLGPVVSAHWTLWSSALPGDRLPMGPIDAYFHGFVQVAAGQVARLLDGHGTAATALPRVSKLLEPFVPAGGSWVRSEELDRRLLTARGSELFFDRGADLVYVSAHNLFDPDMEHVGTGPDGKATTTPPSQYPVQP
ncbi:hypothetical protein [Kitasatospora terrestris]|uniref:hypothetical protein n=1 Tax=Kitasatospora terrestris TaxID=258051 RepID=UPI0031EB4AF3